MRMEYPSKQKWGAVFIVSGFVAEQPRPYENFSKFKTLSFELKGELGGENVMIGIKDRNDPDDGSESKILLCHLKNEWTSFNVPLILFKNADLSKLYVVIEFVFEGELEQTVHFRNIKYIPTHIRENGVCNNEPI